jgi:hypothetical protein
MPNWCRVTVKKDDKEIISQDILASNYSESIEVMKESYPNYTEEKGYKYESLVINDGHPAEDWPNDIPMPNDEDIEFMAEMSERNTGSDFFETKKLDENNTDSCSAMNLDHRVVMISPDKSKQFLEDSKKNVIKPEFLEQCLKYSKMLKKEFDHNIEFIGIFSYDYDGHTWIVDKENLDKILNYNPSTYYEEHYDFDKNGNKIITDGLFIVSMDSIFKRKYLKMKVKIQFEVLEESTNIKTVAMWD